MTLNWVVAISLVVGWGGLEAISESGRRSLSGALLGTTALVLLDAAGVWFGAAYPRKDRCLVRSSPGGNDVEVTLFGFYGDFQSSFQLLQTRGGKGLVAHRLGLFNGIVRNESGVQFVWSDDGQTLAVWVSGKPEFGYDFGQHSVLDPARHAPWLPAPLESKLSDATLTVPYLIDRGYEMGPLLTSSVRRNDASVAEAILTKAPDIANSQWACRALVVAAGGGDGAMTQLLLTNQTSPNCRDDRSRTTPLAVAAARGHRAVCELLLQHGANISTPSATGETPLSLAVQNGHMHIADLLRRTKPDASSR